MTIKFRNPILLFFCLAAAACQAPISFHEIHPAPPAALVIPAPSLKAASRLSANDIMGQAAATLEAIRDAHDLLAKGDSRAIGEYNYLTARLVEQIRAAGVKPWMNEIEVPGTRTRYILRGHQPGDLRAEEREFIAADSLRFSGEYAKTSDVQKGLGAPLLAILKDSQTKGGTHAETIRHRSVTAVVHFSGNKATVELVDPYQTDSVSIGGHRYQLHADFRANVAYNLAEERIDKLGLARLINPQRFSDTCRLGFLQPYDPGRIPVLLVHGLDSTPAAFTPMYFKLMEDPAIRRKYQFWYFSYPSGYPYPYSGSLLRKEMDRINRQFPGHKDIVMIGHSMGSLLTRLMVTDVGDELWRSYFGKSPAETKLSEKNREILERSLVFGARKDVDRVIFMSAPHKGSELASNWVGRVSTRLVRTPALFADVRDSLLGAFQNNPVVMQSFSNAPNSIESLSPNAHFVLEINKHPVDSRVPFHSVIGDRGKGDTPDSSDGVVPYWSSHMEGAVSEKIVPSGHSTEVNPEGIQEVRRILLLHASSR